MEDLTIDSVKQKNASVMKAIRLSIICAFMTAGVFLYLIGVINLFALCLLVFGAIWNYSVSINSYMAVLFSVIVGVLYSLISVYEGLYINAILYSFFYVPLQLAVWVRYRGMDMAIPKDRKITKMGAYYTVIAMLLCFVSLFAVSLVLRGEVLPFFDALVACMLGLSAVLVSFRFREYYIVRPIALILVILLWRNDMVINGVTHGVIAVLMMYSMYLVLDVISLCNYVLFDPSRSFSKQVELQSVREATRVNRDAIIDVKIGKYRELAKVEVEAIDIKQNMNSRSKDNGIWA